MPKKSFTFETAQVLGVALEVGFIIALPIVGLGLLGKYLDQRMGTHLFIFLGILLAISASSLWMYRRFSAILERLKKAAQIKAETEKKEIDI